MGNVCHNGVVIHLHPGRQVETNDVAHLITMYLHVTQIMHASEMFHVGSHLQEHRPLEDGSDVNMSKCLS